MKRIFFAALLACAGFAFARADEGAYGSLIGMAGSAKTDRGPDAGPMPDRVSDRPANRWAGCGTEGRADGRKAERPEALAGVGVEIDEGAALKDAIAQPLAPKPRLWTRLYATLLPAWRRAPVPLSAFEPSVSTGTARVLAPMPVLMPPPDSESVKAGERRGLAELLSASAAPTAGQ